MVYKARRGSFELANQKEGLFHVLSVHTCAVLQSGE